MSDKELNLPDYIEFTYNRFIMTRVEYLIFTQNEQESKVLRVIEWCIENERARLYREAKARTPQGQKVEISDIVWVPISHRFFLDQLHGTVQSETTLKSILTTLKKKHFIFQEPGGAGPYDPPIYTINKHLLADLTKLLPGSLDDLDMTSILKQERKIKKVREGQKLTPSKIDPLVIKIRESINGPLDPQLLALYLSKIGPLSRSTGGQKLTPKIYKDKQEDNKDNITHSSNDSRDTHTSSFLQSQLTEQEKTIASLQAMVEQQQKQIAQLLQAKAEAVTSLSPVEAIETPPPNDTPSQQTQTSGDSVETPDSDAVVVGVVAAQGKQRGRGGNSGRKPKVPKVVISDEDNARIDTFLECMDKSAQEALEEETHEKSDFTFTRTKVDRETIHEFLKGRTISFKLMRQVYMTMWKSPQGKDGFLWKEHMSIAAYCRNYDQMLLKSMSQTRTNSAPEQTNQPAKPKITDAMKQRRELQARYTAAAPQSPTVSSIMAGAR